MLSALFGDLLAGHEVDIEKLLDDEFESQDQSALIEYLESLLENPININEASAQELSTIPWLSSVLAIRIIYYRYQNGAFHSVEDVQRVNGVQKVFPKIRPFLTVGSRRVSLQVQGRHRLISRMEDSKAFQQNIYGGGKNKVLHRIKGILSRHIHFGLLCEKDPGEPRLNDLQIGHLKIDVPLLQTTIFIGHFAAGFGQGLVFGGPYQTNARIDGVRPGARAGRGIVPFLSVAENEAFCGIALTSRFKRGNVHAFVSRQKRDARIENGQVIARPSSGLHRTVSELENKKQLAENSRALALEMMMTKSGLIGAAVQQSLYDFPFSQKSGVQQHEFYGSSNHVLSCYFDQTILSLNLFGEIAQSGSRGRAAVLGVACDYGAFDFISIYRCYDENYQNFYAHSLSSRQTISNETGFYFGVRYRPARGTTALLSIDQHNSMWPQIRDPMPSSGYAALSHLEHKFSSQLCLSLRYRATTKYSGQTVADRFGNPVREMCRSIRSTWRLQLDFAATAAIQFRSRLELSSFTEYAPVRNPQKSGGILLYEEIRWLPHRSWRLQIRWTFFDAPGYDVRLYQFENDLPGVMRIKMLSGRGARWYIVGSYQLGRHLHIHCKYENTYMDDESGIGSGNDRLNSPYENVWSAQLDWHF